LLRMAALGMRGDPKTRLAAHRQREYLHH
jgi:hypothetical protein